jgi:hypothetical protein
MGRVILGSTVMVTEIAVIIPKGVDMGFMLSCRDRTGHPRIVSKPCIPPGARCIQYILYRREPVTPAAILRGKSIVMKVTGRAVNAGD